MGSTEAFREVDSPAFRVSSCRFRRTPVTGTDSGPVTVTVMGLEVTPPHWAVICAFPLLLPVTTPLLSTEAMPGESESQVTGFPVSSG